MNDPIKYLITGAAIAIVCGAAGSVGGWTAARMKNEELGVKNSKPQQKPSTVSFQPSAISGQSSVFSGQRMAQNPVITIAPKASGMTNGIKRLSTSAPAGAMGYSQFQKMQELPEVKRAREEFMEAQRRYSEAVKKAMQSDGGRGAGDGKGNRRIGQ